MIMVFNRIMWNTLEQATAFVCLLYVVSTLNPFDWSQKYFIHIVRMFILSRVIYSITYILSQVTGLSGLRRYGFVGTLTANMCLLLAIFGVNIFQYISMIPVPKMWFLWHHIFNNLSKFKKLHKLSFFLVIRYEQSAQVHHLSPLCFNYRWMYTFNTQAIFLSSTTVWTKALFVALDLTSIHLKNILKKSGQT